MLAQKLLGFTLLGSEWVLWLLVALSVLSVTVMVERALHMRGRGALDLDAVARTVAASLGQRSLEGARKAFAGSAAPEARVALAGLDEHARGADAVAEAMAAAKAREKLDLERNLGVLGTLGSNAPFIGLFGTVLGIIRAFADLARAHDTGPQVVMAGISEALVATAVGLLVAIPAVIAFNVFQGKVRRAMSRIDAVAHLVLSAAKGPAGERAAAE